MKATQVAKDSAKEDKYKRGKVPLESIGKKSNEKPKANRKPPKCGNCGVSGHTRVSCLQPGGGSRSKSKGKGGSAPSWLNAL